MKVAGADELDLSPYAGRWVAIIRGRVAGVGFTAAQARLAAKRNRPKEEPELIFVPPETPSPQRLDPRSRKGKEVKQAKADPQQPVQFIPPGSRIEQVCRFVAGRGEAYLVGGYLRDLLMGRFSHDLDLAVREDGFSLARRIADRFGGFFVPLDRERNTGRAVLQDEKGERLFVDVARLRGGDIQADLAGRDFTVDAMALPLSGSQTLIDPFGGREDLQRGSLRVVSPRAFRDDPLRTLRAVRLAAELNFRIEPRTESLIRRDAAFLPSVSAERKRDELVKILALPHSAAHLAKLDELGLLGILFPELAATKGVSQSEPHYLDVFQHSLETVGCLEAMLALMRGEEAGQGCKATPKREDLAPLHPERLLEHLTRPTSGDRTRLIILKLTALLHDVGKPLTVKVERGRTRFFGHEGLGGRMTARIFGRLRFSAAEKRMARTIVVHHMRPALLAQVKVFTRRAVYRFFRDTGEAGVEVILLSLADHLATWGPHLIPARWHKRLAVASHLLNEFYTRYREVVSPPKLIDGKDLMTRFGLPPGPLVGRILEAVREAQAAGEIRTKEEALQLAAHLLDKNAKGR